MNFSYTWKFIDSCLDSWLNLLSNGVRGNTARPLSNTARSCSTLPRSPISTHLSRALPRAAVYTWRCRSMQSDTCRSDTATHAKHAHTERAQCEIIGSHASLPPAVVPALADSSFCRLGLHGRLAGLSAKQTRSLRWKMTAPASARQGSIWGSGPSAIRPRTRNSLSPACWRRTCSSMCATYIHKSLSHASTWLLSVGQGLAMLIGQADQSQVGPC